MSSLMAAAMYSPAGTVALFALFSLGCVAFAIVRGLSATAGTWGPYALLALAGGALYGCHRYLWTPLAEDPRTPRRITGGILLAILLVFEACTGRIGILVGRVTGYNPEAVLMDAGLPVPGTVRSAIVERRQFERQGAACSASMRSGVMVQGTSASVDLTMLCAGHLQWHEIRDACLKLAANKATAISYANVDFCRSVDVGVTYRESAVQR